MATTTVPPVQPLTQSAIDAQTTSLQQAFQALQTIATQFAALLTANQNQVASLQAQITTLTAANASQAATITELEGNVAALSITALSTAATSLQTPIQALSALANAGKTGS